MHPRPIRLLPGVDLRSEIERMVRDNEIGQGFIICGVGSIEGAVIRFANESLESLIDGPHEILSLTGSVSKDGAHLHASISDTKGKVVGGHVCNGNRIRTTAEILLLETPDWELFREIDQVTGYKELVVKPVGKR